MVNLNDDAAMIHFITDHKQPLNRYIESRFNPIYPFDLNGMRPYLDGIRLNGKYPLYTAQKHVIAATAKGFEQRNGILLVGQMGTGKTALGSQRHRDWHRRSQSHAGQPKRGASLLIVCPPHLVNKWEREARSISPRTFIAQIKRHEDLKVFMEKAANLGPGIAKIGIIKREMTKLGSGHTTAVVWKPHHARWATHEPIPPGTADVPRIERTRTLSHLRRDYPRRPRQPPDDHQQIRAGEKQTHLRILPGAALAEIRDSSSPPPGEKYPRGNPRYRLDKYLKKLYSDRIALLIWDEVHEAQHSDSGNGEAFGRLAGSQKNPRHDRHAVQRQSLFAVQPRIPP